MLEGCVYRSGSVININFESRQSPKNESRNLGSECFREAVITKHYLDVKCWSETRRIPTRSSSFCLRAHLVAGNRNPLWPLQENGLYYTAAPPGIQRRKDSLAPGGVRLGHWKVFRSQAALLLLPTPSRFPCWSCPALQTGSERAPHPQGLALCRCHGLSFDRTVQLWGLPPPDSQPVSQFRLSREKSSNWSGS